MLKCGAKIKIMIIFAPLLLMPKWHNVGEGLAALPYFFISGSSGSDSIAACFAASTALVYFSVCLREE